MFKIIFILLLFLSLNACISPYIYDEQKLMYVKASAFSYELNWSQTSLNINNDYRFANDKYLTYIPLNISGEVADASYQVYKSNSNTDNFYIFIDSSINMNNIFIHITDIITETEMDLLQNDSLLKFNNSFTNYVQYENKINEIRSRNKQKIDYELNSIQYNNQPSSIQTGPRGGKYHINDKGKKVYESKKKK